MTDAAFDDYRDSAGPQRVGILPANELIGLQLDAARGDADARAVVAIAFGLIQQITDAPPNQPAKCACCPRHIRRGEPWYVGIAMRVAGEPTTGLGFLICSECGFTPPRVDAVAARIIAGGGA